MSSVAEPVGGGLKSSSKSQGPSLLRRLSSRLATYHKCVGKLGLGPTLTLLRAHISRVTARGVKRVSEPRPLRLKGYSYPVYFRPGTSDLFVVLQIFLEEEYACVAHERDVQFIVDCGANAGYSAVYLLNKYPQARLVAVEPDAGNAEICRKNLVPFGARAEVIQAGVWPRDAQLKVERGTYRDGLEWSFHVRPIRDGESSDINAVGLPTLLARAPSGRIDLLKVDIERAELELFAEGTQDWLPKVRTLAIELHDDECRAVFQRVVAPLDFAISESDELTIARRTVG